MIRPFLFIALLTVLCAASASASDAAFVQALGTRLGGWSNANAYAKVEGETFRISQPSYVTIGCSTRVTMTVDQCSGGFGPVTLALDVDDQRHITRNLVLGYANQKMTAMTDFIIAQARCALVESRPCPIPTVQVIYRPQPICPPPVIVHRPSPPTVIVHRPICPPVIVHRPSPPTVVYRPAQQPRWHKQPEHNDHRKNEHRQGR